MLTKRLQQSKSPLMPKAKRLPDDPIERKRLLARRESLKKAQDLWKQRNPEEWRIVNRQMVQRYRTRAKQKAERIMAKAA